MWGASQRVTPANREATVHPSSLSGWPLKEGVARLCVCVFGKIWFERLKNLHFSEILEENLQRIILLPFPSSLKLKIHFFPAFQRIFGTLFQMLSGLNNTSKLPLGVCACMRACVCALSDELMTCPGCILASRLVTAGIRTTTCCITDEEQVTVNRNWMD